MIAPESFSGGSKLTYKLNTPGVMFVIAGAVADSVDFTTSGDDETPL